MMNIPENCPKCQKRLMLNISNTRLFCPMVNCNYFMEIEQKSIMQQNIKKSQSTYAETISLIDELKDEYVLLESIRQCAKELVEITENYPLSSNAFCNQLAELKHLVLTD